MLLVQGVRVDSVDRDAHRNGSAARFAPGANFSAGGRAVADETDRTCLSVMLIVADAVAAVGWYKTALGASELWDLGGVAGLQLGGAPFFVHEAVPGKQN